MNAYSGFARVYDKFMPPPQKWTNYIDLLWKTHDVRPKTVLDLACGTGSVTIKLAQRGYELIGIDSSCEMLSVAKRKSEKSGQDILFLNQDMREFELYGTVDAIICLCDSINYILELNELQKVFSLVYNYLNPKGFFIFDINTEHKYLNKLANNVFSEAIKSSAYIWENNYDPEQRINEYFVTFFAKKRKSDLYERFEEYHYEKAFRVCEIEQVIANAKLLLLGKYDEFSLKNAHENSERIFFVAKK